MPAKLGILPKLPDEVARSLAQGPIELPEPATFILAAVKAAKVPVARKDGGVPWDALVAACQAIGLDEAAIEDAFNKLFDAGLIYEPVLALIKETP